MEPRVANGISPKSFRKFRAPALIAGLVGARIATPRFERPLELLTKQSC
jgi:hypothetical protein